MATYTYAQLKSRINSKIKGKIGILIDARETLNEGVRQAVFDIDFVSMRRRTALTPNLFRKVFEYAAPTDIKNYGIIGIEPQTDRALREYILVPSEQFYRRQDPNTIAFDDADMVTKILVNTDQPNDLGIMVAPLDTTTSGGGTWQAVGDGTNIRADSDNFVRENGSLRWDIGSGATTTAGVKNTSLNSFDASDYFGGNGALFVWVWITSTTNLTNFILRIGSSEANYYQKTITAASDGTTFKAGWNLLRFDLSSLTTTGTPDEDAFTFISLYMTKTAGKINETDYRFDSIILKRGEPNNLVYQSSYGWQSSGGTYKQDSTADSDYLNCDSDEYNIIIDKCAELAADEVDEDSISEKYASKYKTDKRSYELQHPSEVKSMISTYADFKRT